MTGGWLEEIGRQLRSVSDVLLDEARAGACCRCSSRRRCSTVPGCWRPAIAVGGLIAIILLSGMAVAALGSLLLALLALYLLLANLFGLSIELHPFARRADARPSRRASPTAPPRTPGPGAAGPCGRRSRGSSAGG